MTYRNRKLLDLAHDAPCFLDLGTVLCGRDAAVPCHSDMLRHGRGVGHKSSDVYAIPGCPACHAVFTRARWGRSGYEAIWRDGFEKYVLWLWENEKIKVIR